MSPLPIYASLNFSTTASPSLTCLQWSGDGQVFFVTKNSVFIMTPYYAPIIKVPSSKAIGDPKSLGWFRTTIEIDKKQCHDWSAVSQDWTAVVLGSLDVGLRAIAVSPSNVTKDAGCVVCVLSSDMDLTLWGPTKNRYQGEWTKIQELTSLLKDCCQGYGPPKPVAHALQAQATSITWSSQADFGIDPAPVHDASFLAVGTRGGTLHFLRFENEMISSVVKIKVSNDWLTHLAFSPWSLVERGRCEAQIAWGTSTGGVGLVTVTQSLNSCPSKTAYGPTFSVKSRMEHQAQKVFNPDKRGLTALTWVVSNENLILVACKSGLVSLWSPGSCDLGWSGTRSLLFQSQKLSVGSSPLQPVTGIYYVPHEDALIISLFDGSLHVVHNLSSEPSWASGRGSLTSQGLSTAIRTASVPTESGGLHSNIVNRISGLVPYGHATALWAHESCQPADFGYNYDSKRHNMLITAQLFHCPSDDIFLRELATILSQAKTTMGQSPLYLLRPCFLYLSDHLEVYPHVIRLLHSPLAIQPNLLLGNAPCPPDVTTPREYRQSLTRYFFGWDLLLQLRLKLAIADFLLRSAPDCSVRDECEQIACHLFRLISQIVLRILIRHLMPLAMTLTLGDVPFALRIIDQSMFSGCPPDLVIEAKKLSDIMHAAVPSVLAGERLRQNIISESCPACDAEILLESGAHAVCADGHSWGRCSVTSFILSTAMVRQCIGCSRKAFLPLSCDLYPDIENWLPQPAKSWIVVELLEAVTRCLFCGNNFTNVL